MDFTRLGFFIFFIGFVRTNNYFAALCLCCLECSINRFLCYHVSTKKGHLFPGFYRKDAFFLISLRQICPSPLVL